MSTPSPFHPVALAMQGVINLSNELEREVARLLGVNLTDYRALSTLASTGEVAVGHLATTLGATPATTTAIVDRLESRGLVTRQRSEDDRRQVRVSVTPDAIQRIIGLLVSLMRGVNEYVVGLSEHDQGVVQAFLVAADEHMRDHLAALAATEGERWTA